METLAGGGGGAQEHGGSDAAAWASSGSSCCLSAEEIAWSEPLEPPIRWRYRRSRTLLRQRLAGLLATGAAAVPLHSPPGRAPRLLAGYGWVSLSHSGAGLLLAWSPWPIGIDLEPHGRQLEADLLQRRYFPPSEQHQLRELDGEARRQAVLRSWVLKEAAIKWRRRQLATELRHWRLDHASGTLSHTAEGLQPECVAAVSGAWLWAAVGRGVAGLILEGGPESISQKSTSVGSPGCTG